VKKEKEKKNRTDDIQGGKCKETRGEKTGQEKSKQSDANNFKEINERSRKNRGREAGNARGENRTAGQHFLKNVEKKLHIHQA